MGFVSAALAVLELRLNAGVGNTGLEGHRRAESEQASLIGEGPSLVARKRRESGPEHMW